MSNVVRLNPKLIAVSIANSDPQSALDDGDDLRAAKGIGLSVILGVICWLAGFVIAAVWAWWWP